MSNINSRLFILFLIQTVFFSLIGSSIVNGNTALVYAKENSSEKSSGADSSNNNNNPSTQSSATPSQVCNSSHDNSACQESQQAQVKQQQQPAKPDDSCLFHPEQTKCKPDAITGKCPKGFSMNVNQHCYPNKPCPNGFERHKDDETGTCYPIQKSSTAK